MKRGGGERPPRAPPMDPPLNKHIVTYRYEAPGDLRVELDKTQRLTSG